MVGRIFPAVICALMVLPLTGQAGREIEPVPARPLDGVFDPEAWLKESMRAEVVRKILNVREKQRARVFVVALPERPPDGPGLAARWGAEWGEGMLWGVLLHVPGEEGFPLFEAGLARSPAWSEEQKGEFERSLEKALAKVGRGGAVLSGEREKVARGAADLADELGYLSLIVTRMDRHQAQARGDRAHGKSGQEEPKAKVSLITIVLSLVGILSAFIIFVLLRRSDDGDEGSGDGGAFWFPDTIPRKRFRAPWSGGGNVLVEFRRDQQNRRR